jgi:acyl transferase domain-containing protein
VLGSRDSSDSPEGRDSRDVAIVGMACILPGAPDVEAFWANVVDGVDSVSEVPGSRWDQAAHFDPSYDSSRRKPDEEPKSISKWGGFVPDVGFDALAWGIPPASLASVDMAQLMALKTAANALSDAGLGPGGPRADFDRERASVIYATGSGGASDLPAGYLLRLLLATHGIHQNDLPPELHAFLPELTEDGLPGVLTSVIAGRVANRLDLGGKNLTVDSACASVLVALDIARNELLSRASDVVLCGGVDLHNGAQDYVSFTAAQALSRSGRCRSFDADGDGMTLAEGCGCLVLKRLSDASRDGDRIYAVVRGVGGSSDGRSLGLTAPRQEGQERAVRRAYADAGLSPASIGLIEAHGTGTVAGDRTELLTTTAVFTEAGAAPGSIVLGSVKSNIGHTKCASAVASLIKAAKSAYHGVLPPTLHINRPNDVWDPETSPFVFRDQARPWLSDRRLVAVSSFGFGGTNFHTILENHRAGSSPAAASDASAATTPDRRPAAPVTGPATLDTPSDASVPPTRASAAPATAPATISSGPAPAGASGEPVVGSAALSVAPVSGRPQWPAELFVFRGSPADVSAQLDALAERLDEELVPPVQADRWRLRDVAAQVNTDDSGLWISRQDEISRAQNEEVLAPSARGGDARPTPGTSATGPTGPGDLAAEPGAMDARVTDESSDAGHADGRRGATGKGDHHQRAGHAGGGAADRPAPVRLAIVASDLADLAAKVEAARSGSAMAGVYRADDDMALVGSAVMAAGGHLAGASGGTGEGGTGDLGDTVDQGGDGNQGGTGAEGPEVAFLAPGVGAVRPGMVADVLVAVPELREQAMARDGIEPGTVEAMLPAQGFGDDARSRQEAALDQVSTTALTVAQRTLAGALRRFGVVHDHVVAGDGDDAEIAEAVRRLSDDGVTVFVEVGPGTALTDLVHRTLGDRPHVAVPTDRPGEHGLTTLLHALAQLAVAGVPVDVAALHAGRGARPELWADPPKKPGWIINGHFARTAGGASLPKGLRPASEAPPFHIAGGPGPAEPAAAAAASGNGNGNGTAGGLSAEQTAVIMEYLRIVQGVIATGSRIVQGHAQAQAEAHVQLPAEVGQVR